MPLCAVSQMILMTLLPGKSFRWSNNSSTLTGEEKKRLNSFESVNPEVFPNHAKNIFLFRTSFKCAMMFKNLTDLPLKVLDIIPDLIAQNDDPEITAELEKKEISFEAFEIDDVCPAPGVTGGQRLKQINSAKKRANARCYAFVSIR